MPPGRSTLQIPDGCADGIAARSSPTQARQVVLRSLADCQPDIDTKPTAKYLVVVIGSKMGFGEQVQRTADKGSRGLLLMAILQQASTTQSSVNFALIYGFEVTCAHQKCTIFRRNWGLFLPITFLIPFE